ncbi:unnamed protein product [Caretta caretta]
MVLWLLSPELQQALIAYTLAHCLLEFPGTQNICNLDTSFMPQSSLKAIKYWVPIYREHCGYRGLKQPIQKG